MKLSIRSSTSKENREDELDSGILSCRTIDIFTAEFGCPITLTMNFKLEDLIKCLENMENSKSSWAQIELPNQDVIILSDFLKTISKTKQL
jgi:hypothetical protein